MNAPAPTARPGRRRRVLAAVLLAALALAAGTWWAAQRPAAQRVVRVGLYENPPKVYTGEGGQAAGLFPELLDELARLEGWQLQYQACEWAACLELLAQGRLDLMPDVAYSPERDQRFDFHTVSVASSWSQVYAAPQRRITTLRDLAGRRIALLAGGVQQSYFHQLMAGAGLDYTEVPVTTLAQGYAAVAEGRADAVLTNSFYAAANAARYRLQETPIVLLPSTLYFATGQGRNADLLARVDQHLRGWRNDSESVYFRALRRAMAAPPELHVPGWVRWALPVLAALGALLAGVALLLRWQVGQRTAALARTAQALERERAGLEQQVEERTARLRAIADSLQRATEEQQAVFDAATVGILLSRDSCIVRCNRTLERLLGHPPGALQGQGTRTLYPDEASFLATRQRIFDDVAAHGFHSEELPLAHRDGHAVWCRLMVQAIDRQDPAKGLAGTVEDITVQRAAIAAVERARALAEDAAQAKADFLANMSHELRTPMNSVIGLTHLALRSAPPTALREQLLKIQRSGQHLLGVVNDILDYSRIDAGKLALECIGFDLDRLLDDVMALVAERARTKGLATRIDVADDVPRHLVGDPLRLRQVLLNYTHNAVKFTEHGEVALRVTRAPGHGTTTEGATDGNAAWLRFEVRDTGIGLSEAQRARLFQSFQQADTSTTRRYGGSGLGLAIAKRLAGLMHGEVGVDSVPGQGSTFWFTARLDTATGPLPEAAPALLPPAVSAAAGALDTEAPAGPDAATADGNAQAADAPTPEDADDTEDTDGPAALAGARVLLVEDNDLNQEVALALLHHLGLQVDVAGDGAEAVARVQQQAYDAVLMDVQMPVMDGLSATRAIRRLPAGAGLPILAMTANAMREDRARCLAAGMDDHLAKPIEPEQLIAKLQRWLRPAGPPPDIPADAPR